MSFAVVFEDAGWSDLYPITLSRPSFDCRIGVSTLALRLGAHLARHDIKRVDFLCRPVLRPLVERDHPGHRVNHRPDGDVVFLNGRLVCLDQGWSSLWQLLDRAVAIEHEGGLVAARVHRDRAGAFAEALADALENGQPAPIPTDHTVLEAPEGVRVVRHLWDLIGISEAVLREDFEFIREHQPTSLPEMSAGAQVLGRDHIIAREGARVDAGAILDATVGPVILGEGVRIQSQAVVQGPVYLGTRSIVRPAARLEGPVVTGPMVKVGGEVEGSIIQGYSNKQHDGFLGHSYVGSWVNLGAGTNTSDLRNDYGPVRVRMPGGIEETGTTFVGSLIGDHSKTAIGTQLNTGTLIGFSCNVFGAGFPPVWIPSFSWGTGRESPYRLQKAVEVARTVMARRDIDMEPADQVLFESIYGDAERGIA